MQLIKSLLYDYGKLYQSSSAYFECYPQTIDDIQAIVKKALHESMPIRVRASGHTLNGSTLPYSHECLLRMPHFDHYRFEEPGTITVGVGSLMWDVRDFVLNYGLQLPVYNGGWGGPSVGGFISSGGMGLRRQLTFVPPGGASPAPAEKGPDVPSEDDNESLSARHGGFWENVLSITLVDGIGEVRTFDTQDEEFKWLFSSFGQLGVLVEAKLKLLPVPADNSATYPLGQTGTMPKVQPENPNVTNIPPPAQGINWLYWFSYLIAPDQEPDVWEELGPMVEKHVPAVRPEGGWVGPSVGGTPIGYCYTVRFKTFNPPLLYPVDEDFLLIGFMAVLGVGTPRLDAKIFEVEKEFVDIALHRNFKLYLQAENLGLTVDYKTYYGDEIYHHFKQLKDRFDPHYLLNRGIFFPSDVGKPTKASTARLAASIFKKFLNE
jgi:FAD/FMN-containing dehydrogenase